MLDCSFTLCKQAELLLLSVNFGSMFLLTSTVKIQDTSRYRGLLCFIVPDKTQPRYVSKAVGEPENLTAGLDVPLD